MKTEHAPIVLHLDDTRALQSERTGGKGSNLARLTQLGFNVPAGFVIEARFYREFAAPARDAIAAALPPAGADPMSFRRASEMIAGIISRLQLPANLEAGVNEALDKFPADTPFAVRSSSTFEDLAGAAFAGQHDTFLNVRGREQVLAKIRECYRSLWNERVISYRAQKGFDHNAVAMAVVVQQLVDAEVAGVGFSVNPVSGDLTEIVVDANFGLGESVVGGEMAVDHWEIDKTTSNVRREFIAEKNHRIVSAGDGVREIRASPDDARRPALDTSQIGQLAKLLRDVENACNFPQDIEWCFAGGKLWLLQSRPVTKIAPRWTRDESAERFPNTISPLTWDLVNEGFHQSLEVSFRMIGLPPCHSAWFALHDHYVYGDQNLVDLYLRSPVFAPRSLDDVRAALPMLRERFRWVQELPGNWTRDLDAFLLKLGSLSATPLDGLDAGELWRHVQEIQKVACGYFEPNIAISITHATLHRLLAHLIRLVMGAGADRICDGLFAHNETNTAAINRELYELATMVRATPELERLMKSESSMHFVQSDAAAAFPEFSQRFARFLADHGHREMEFDMYHAPWGEAPWIVIDNIRLILTGPMDTPPATLERQQKMRSEAATFELLGRVPSDLRFFFNELIRLVRAYTALDDLEHYETFRLMPVFRRALREFGKRIQTATHIADPMDVYFARRSQIDEALRTGTSDAMRQLGNRILEQKNVWQKDRQRTPSWEFGREAEATPGRNELKGLPGSPGIAEGEIWIVNGPEDFAGFPKGAVLVARTTNPSWTPLFYNASAIVTESGGPLSHGAVTAREMGIPAVMSVRQIMQTARNGQHVTVNGSAGTVSVA